MNDLQFSALKTAVTLAKNYQIKTLVELRRRLHLSGFLEEDIEVALTFWSEYARRTKA